MSKEAQVAIYVVLGCTAFAMVVYFLIKAIDAITHPSLVWWGIGFASCAVLEGLAILIAYFLRHRKEWFDSFKEWFRDTFSNPS